MNSIDVNRSVGQIAAEMPHAIPVFEKWNIDYCCGGRRTLVEVCEASNLPIEEVVASLSGESPDHERKSERDWTEESLSKLMDHIVATHHSYTRENLETIAILMRKVLAVHGAAHPELAEVSSLAGELDDALIPHMAMEESVLFPAIRKAEWSASQPESPSNPRFDLSGPVMVMIREHEAAADILTRIREASGDYALPEGACFSYSQLYRRLSELESDLHRHIHLENNVLFDRALKRLSLA